MHRDFAVCLCKMDVSLLRRFTFRQVAIVPLVDELPVLGDLDGEPCCKAVQLAKRLYRLLLLNDSDHFDGWSEEGFQPRPAGPTCRWARFFCFFGGHALAFEIVPLGRSFGVCWDRCSLSTGSKQDFQQYCIPRGSW